VLGLFTVAWAFPWGVLGGRGELGLWSPAIGFFFCGVEGGEVILGFGVGDPTGFFDR